jgi:hypothetical protein
MSSESRTSSKSITAIINPKGQNAESVHAIVNGILGRAGCHTCGLIAVLRVDLLGDPSPEMGKAGAVSVTTEGL